jgi:hypothetical protein
MLTVKFTNVLEDYCKWCNVKKEVYSVSFEDGSFVGNFCMKDLMKAIRVKLPAQTKVEPVLRNNQPVTVK